MKTKLKNNMIALIVFMTFLLMVAVNGLANVLPINGRLTGDVSDKFANLFAPAGITFAIWGVIYLLLLGFVIYQSFNRHSLYLQHPYADISEWFIFSNVINTIWIFAWHFEVIWLSMILIVLILIALIGINMTLKHLKYDFWQILLIKLPFAVYFGWITVATIANMTTFLVSIQWNRFGLSESFWTVTMILIGAVIGFLGILFYRSFAYGIVIVWAYLGIAIKHISSDYFDGKYPLVIVAVGISILLIIVGEILLFRKSISMAVE